MLFVSYFALLSVNSVVWSKNNSLHLHTNIKNKQCLYLYVFLFQFSAIEMLYCSLWRNSLAEYLRKIASPLTTWSFTLNNEKNKCGSNTKKAFGSNKTKYLTGINQVKKNQLHCPQTGKQFQTKQSWTNNSSSQQCFNQNPLHLKPGNPRCRRLQKKTHSVSNDKTELIYNGD